MAEATTTEQVSVNESKFYCHQCSLEILPKLPDFVCPTCEGGFIEEITENFSGNQARNGAAQNVRHPNPFSFLHALVEDEMSEEDEDEVDFGDGAAGALGAGAGPLAGLMPPRTRISVRTMGPNGGGMTADGQQMLPMLIESLLSGLRGAGGGGGTLLFGGGQGPGHPFMFNMPGLGLAGNPGDYAWGPGGLDSIITQLMNQLEGTGPPPAPADKIESLPTVHIKQEHMERSLQCSVCFEHFALEEAVRQLPCQHLFHTDCIKPWLQMHGTCPVCRKTLEGEDTSCDQNQQSIPETLHDMGLDTTSLNPSNPNGSASGSTAPTSTSHNNTGSSSGSLGNAPSSRSNGGSSQGPSTQLDNTRESHQSDCFDEFD